MRDGPRSFTQNFSCSALLRCRLNEADQFRIRGSHPLRPGFPAGSATRHSSLLAPVLQPRAVRCHTRGLGSCAFARHYLRNHCYFLFLRVLRCFSSPGSPTASMRCDGIAPAGFPHSDIRGSRGICPSPRLFAACHVLLRLREPQASPVRPCSLSFYLLVASPHPLLKEGDCHCGNLTPLLQEGKGEAKLFRSILSD